VADEEEKVEETPAAEAEEAPQDDAPEGAAPEAPAEEGAPGEEPAAEEEPPAEAEEAPAEEAAAEAEAPAEESVAAEEPEAEAEAPAAPAEDAEPQEVLTPKELRKRNRSAHSGEARPQRSSEDRATERVEARRAKAAARSRRRSQERAKRGERGEGTPRADREAGVRKSQLGTVVSDKADKTITVRVDIVRRHRRYEKVVRQSATVHAHDERNEASEGDVVRVVESRPLSRTKRWRLVEVIEKAR
jgi:small subunit ribosomal protein S17